MKNPTGLCMCGCGWKAPRSKESRRGYKRGEALMFIRGHSSRNRGPRYVVDSKGCWIWQLSVTTHGYGHFVLDGRHYLAHRWHYELRHGGNSIPKGVEIHHLCGQRACVNPDHLLPVTRRQHMLTEGRKAYGRYPVRDAKGEPQP